MQIGTLEDCGISQQAILRFSAEAESRKNSEPLVVYTVCQFVKYRKNTIMNNDLKKSSVRKNIVLNRRIKIEKARKIC